MLVLLFVISVLALTPANAEARELKTASGHWALNVPRAFKPAPNAPNAAFKMILEDEYHTLVLNVVKEGSVDWKELSPIYQDDDKAFGLQRLLSSVLESFKRDYAETGGRIRSASAAQIDLEILPDHSICDGLEWSVEDIGVPGLRGAVSVMRGYTILCFDFVEGANEFELAHILFSERYRAKLGHEPLKDFHARAQRIMRSLHYTKGPPHITLGVAPLAKDAPIQLSKLGLGSENPAIRGAEAGACSP